MRKQIVSVILMLLCSATLFAQVSKGDIEIFQKYFGVEKAVMVKEYMALTPQQDSVFWPVYNKYESERASLGQMRILLLQEYLTAMNDITDQKAAEMVDKGIAMEIRFKTTQKKYFSEMSKKIGPVKAAQFYQFENYINNVINLGIQENIPLIGDIEKKHEADQPKK